MCLYPRSFVLMRGCGFVRETSNTKARELRFGLVRGSDLSANLKHEGARTPFRVGSWVVFIGEKLNHEGYTYIRGPAHVRPSLIVRCKRPNGRSSSFGNRKTLEPLTALRNYL